MKEMNKFKMNKQLQYLILLLLFFEIHCTSSITELHSFSIQDNRKNLNYDNGQKEFHCFNVNNGMKEYVRGTYGSYGYFEGEVDSIHQFIFHINWYETNVVNGNLNALTGSGVLNYSSTWKIVSGTYWNSGPDDITNSFKSWNSLNGTLLADDSSTTGSDTLLTNCLYPGMNYETPRSSMTILSDSAITSSSNSGSTTFCKIPVGGLGTWLGTYKYEYTMANDGVTGTETGTYGINPMGFYVKSGRGFVGKWIANTGPFAHHTGTNFYLTISRSSRILIVGFYCFVNSNLIRTQCSSESYEVITDKSTSHYHELITQCPQFYQYDNSLESLYEFASIGYSDPSSCHRDKGTTTSWIIATIFIIFSGLLIFTFIYIIVILKNQKNSIILPSEV